ncbi:amidohydrolase family protein [Methanocaldococcus infernus]
MYLKGKFLYGEDYELKEGVLVVEDGEIKGFTNEHVEAENVGLAIPGIFNLHTHIADNCIKDVGINKSLDELVKPPNGLKHKYLSKLSREEIKEAIKEGIKELINFGNRVFCDFREGGVEGVKLLKECLSDDIKAVILGRPTYKGERVLDLSDGYGLSGANEYEDEELRELYKECKRKNKIFSIHAAEHKGALELSLKKYGMTEIERLINLKVVPDFIIHGTHLTEEDSYLIEKYEIPVVLCVRSNLYYNVGLPDLEKIKSIKTLGTDNFMANHPSIFREMEFIYKFYHLEPKEIFRMATINGAKILNLKRVGLIEEGYKPLFTLINPRVIRFSKNVLATIILRVEKGDLLNKSLNLLSK